MRQVNPFNRKQDITESGAYGCACICNTVEGNHTSGQWKAILPGGEKCGCACSSSTTNRNSNDNAALRKGNA